MNAVHQKIVDAVLNKAKQECPGVLDLVGIYGSVCTGDMHEHSDLDLLILINDPRGYVLADTFILEDEKIGYDLFCTTWEMLEEDAKCGHAHLSKLMDSEIVYVRAESVTEGLEKLKEEVRGILGSDRRFDSVRDLRDEICKYYGYAMAAESIGNLRAYAAYVVCLCLDAVMLWNGTYFKRGIKRTFEELKELDIPDDLEENIMRIVKAKNYVELGVALATLFKSVMRFTQHRMKKEEPTREKLEGTYEEIYSNWKNKMSEAAKQGDAFSSFMNLASLQFMFEEIAACNNIPKPQIMEEFDASDLKKNRKLFDEAHESYLQEYEKLAMEARSFANEGQWERLYMRAKK